MATKLFDYMQRELKEQGIVSLISEWVTPTGAMEVYHSETKDRVPYVFFAILNNEYIGSMTVYTKPTREQIEEILKYAHVIADFAHADKIA